MADIPEKFNGDLEFLERYGDAMFDGWWLWDLSDVQKNPDLPLEESSQYMSPAFWRLFGYGPDEMPQVAGSWMKIIDPRHKQEVMERFQKHQSDPDRHPYKQLVRYTHKDGHDVWVICRGKLMTRKDGTQYMLGTHQDMTGWVAEVKARRNLVADKLEEISETFYTMLRANQ